MDAGDLHPSSPSTTSAPPLPPPATSPPATSAPIPSDPCPATIKQKVQAATARVLARGDVGVIILGCAGMAGMEEWVREEVDSGGQTGVRVVDGVKAGVGVLQGLLRGGY